MWLVVIARKPTSAHIPILFSQCITSNNPIVKPPKIKKLPGRPGKVRRKKANESTKTEKLSKRGVVMTCSKCVTQRHNKRECPTRNQYGPSQSNEPCS